MRSLWSGLVTLLLLGSLLPRGGPAVPAAPRTVTLADDGKALALAPGDEFVLALGEAHDWAITIADETIVARVPGAAPPGTQGRYSVLRPGATTLEATGEPRCRATTPPCGAPTRLFRLQLNVVATAPLPGLPHTGGGWAGPDYPEAHAR